MTRNDKARKACGLWGVHLRASRYGGRQPSRGLPAVAHALVGKRERRLAEREGFEPPCRLPGKTLSRRPRYDHFGTSPVLRSRKNFCIKPRLSASSTPPNASIRWFSAGCSCARIADSIAPALGSGAP